MRRTFWQQAFFLGGWIAACITCLATGIVAYNIGYLEGFRQASPFIGEPMPVSASDLLRSIADSILG